MKSLIPRSRRGKIIALCVVAVLITISVKLLSKPRNLHDAAWKGDLKSVKRLIAHGVDVDIPTEVGSTPLQLAKTKEVAEFLISKGANIHHKNNVGGTALHMAGVNGRPEVARVLIENGANVNATDIIDCTPLDHAMVERKGKVKEGQTAVMGLLRLHGGMTKDEMVEREVHGQLGFTALHKAALQVNMKEAQRLIDDGAEVNARDVFGNTPLHQAASSGSKEIVELLLEKGADVNPQGTEMVTPLIIAAGKGHEDTVTILLEHGANVDMQDKESYTALHWAIFFRHRHILELLLNKGAKVNVKDKQGFTPLEVAIGKNYEDIEALLREHGATQ